jgi:sterol desaturase/sphingolipid hydroxylase (fatty acid hydroxylase superfamily)
MTSQMYSEQPVKIGEGRISGIMACFLGALSLLGVLSFHFPEYMTTPEIRAVYDVEIIRKVLFGALVLAGSLGLLNVVRAKNRKLGLIAWGFVITSIALGGHRVEVGDFADGTLYIGMDWFILDLLGSSVIFILLEKILPFRSQSVMREHWQTDLNHFLLNHLLIGFVLLSSNMFVANYFGWAVNANLQAWIKNMPFLLELFVVLLAADLVQYWAHRAYHEIPALWRLHAVHHSVKHMDWIAGSRQHIFEIFISRALVLVPIYILGFSKEVIDAYVIIVGFQAVFNHANVQINFGFLKYIFVTPQFHHWHHSSDEAGLDKNYALHFSFLDYLFGSAVSSDQEWPDGYGVVGDYVPDGLINQQLFPFKWDGK